MVKKSPPVQETRVWSLGGEDPLEKGMTTQSGIVAWRIPWTEEPGGLQSMGSQELDTTERLTLWRNSAVILWVIFSYYAYLIFSLNFQLDDNCFTTLYWFLPYINTNQTIKPWYAESSYTLSQREVLCVGAVKLVLVFLFLLLWKDWCWSWSSNPLAPWCKELTCWKRPCCCERLKAKGEEVSRAWDG